MVKWRYDRIFSYKVEIFLLLLSSKRKVNIKIRLICKGMSFVKYLNYVMCGEEVEDGNYIFIYCMSVSKFWELCFEIVSKVGVFFEYYRSYLINGM